ncbi:MAG: PorP/SprF family type IX secretion system membrane protein [Saprospirales bacterium]|jgi:type IX secretion system PorP/SprF family membrane protein|nr:PorP/SprF family type IX secretion system membrane protein [Saprospirales bacterium]MBK8923587.1 PorP/SprF family type IX secretion system membrane protein [Saprospirales bacterium]
MKKTFSTLIFGLFVFAAMAQEQALYSHYQVFPHLINPGVTGFDNSYIFLANARSSWTGFPGSPTTYTFMYNGPIGDKLGLGGSILSEKIGAQNVTRLQGSYSFRFQVQRARIGLGLTTEFLRRRVSGDVLNNPIVDPNDGVLEGSVDGQRLFTSSFGAHLLFDERVFASLVLPTAIRARLDEIPLDDPRTESGSGIQYYIFQLGAIVDVPSQNFKLVPSIAIRNVRDVPFQFDLNLQGRFLEDKLIAGLTYRPNTGGSMAFLLGTHYKQFNLFYTYDVSFGPFQQYNSGSHEFSVAYAFERRKSRVPLEKTDLYEQNQ